MVFDNQTTKAPELPSVGGNEKFDGFSAELATQMADAVSKTISRPQSTPRVGEPEGNVLEITPAPELKTPGENTGKDNTDKAANKPTKVVDETVAGQILSASQLSVGEKRWQESENTAATAGGKLGASAAVSAVLRDAGVNVDEVSIGGLEQALLQKGWQKIPFDQRLPGDVVIARRDGTYGNSGIVGEGNTVYSNSSQSRVWRPESSSQWAVDGHQRYSQVYVLRPGDESK